MTVSKTARALHEYCALTQLWISRAYSSAAPSPTRQPTSAEDSAYAAVRISAGRTPSLSLDAKQIARALTTFDERSNARRASRNASSRDRALDPGRGVSARQNVSDRASFTPKFAARKPSAYADTALAQPPRPPRSGNYFRVKVSPVSGSRNEPSGSLFR